MNTLVMFAKFPEPGNVKTRLAKDLGKSVACDVYKEFLQDLAKEHSYRKYGFLVATTPPECVEKMQSLLHMGSITAQVGSGLGERLLHTVEEVLSYSEKIVIIGSDMPHLTTAMVEEAFSHLATHDVVLGPAEDGGYYLVGLKMAHNIFRNIDWSTSKVLVQTLRLVEQKGLSYVLMEKHRDVDTLEDLRRLKDNTNKYEKWLE